MSYAPIKVENKGGKVRNRRAIIFDDNSDLLSLLKDYFTHRGYEVVTDQDPVVCPECENNANCRNLKPCADIFITDFNMPKMNGIERLKEQSQRGCKIPARSKALISADIDDNKLKSIDELGSAFLEKPFSLKTLSAWLDEREQLMDLSEPLGIMRKDKRHEGKAEVTYMTSPDEKDLKGVVVNTSPSGVCLKIDAPLKEDLPVMIRLYGPGEIRSALVRWVKEVESGFYLAGLSFN